jgi:hypothetical protein
VKWILSIILLCNVFASEQSPIPVENFDQQEFKLKKHGLLTYSIFKIEIYQIAYYQNLQQNELLVLEYLRDIDREKSNQGWDHSLEEKAKNSPLLSEELKWLKENTVDMKKGDKLFIQIDQLAKKVSLYKNRLLLNSKVSHELCSIVLSPWIGKDSIVDLKDHLNP